MNKYEVVSWDVLARKAADYAHEFLIIGPVPNEEKCIQAGKDFEAALLECRIYADQLLRAYGQLPEGCDLVIIESFREEAGYYHEVGIYFKDDADQVDANDELLPSPCSDFAQKIESGCEIWDDQARKELIEHEHPLYVAKVIQMKKSA